MMTTSLPAKVLFALTVIAFMFLSCSKHSDNNLLPTPDLPEKPQAGTPPSEDNPEDTGHSSPEIPSFLQITDGILTGVTGEHEEITLPAGVRQITEKVFYGKNIRKIVLNEELESIGTDAFAFSTLEEINFPSHLKTIGKYAFYKCEKLHTADLERTEIEELPEGVFGASGIQTLLLPTRLTNIGSQAFMGTLQLKTVKLPGSVKKIGVEAFRESGLTAVDLHNNLSLIATRAFYYCANLQEVRTYGSVISHDPTASIQSYSFEGCTELTAFAIPENIRRLGQGLLVKNKNVKSITIPAQVNHIAFSAFDNTGIEHVTVKPVDPPTTELVNQLAWYGFPRSIKNMEVPQGTIERYRKAPGWNEFIEKMQ